MILDISNNDMYDFTWSLIQDYYKSGKSSVLVKHLTDSYNDFITNKATQVIAGFNKIVIHNTYIPEIDNYKFLYEVEIDNLTLSTTKIHELDGSTSIMTPNNARTRNFNYSAPMFIDIQTTAKTYDENTKEYVTDSQKFKHVAIGKMPIMVKSRYCILNSHTLHDECPYDVGGYFVVNGNEKVVISQDRIAENKTYVFESNKVSAYSHLAEIRSVIENKFSVPKITSLKLSSKPSQFGRFIRVNIHHIKHDIPLIILFRALGIESDHEIIKFVVYDTDASENQIIINELIGSIEEGNICTCRHDALEYLSRYLNMSGNPKEFTYNKQYRLKMIDNILSKEFLPHVGTDLRKKALYMGYMTRKLLKCFKGLQPFDDRDSYVNKRVDTPGVLLGNLFRQCYGKVIKDMKNMLQKEINNGSWRASGKLINVMNKVNMSKIIKPTIVEGGIKYALATGNWGMKTNKSKQGVAQVANRMSYNSKLSHMRRVNTPIEKSGKLIQPRKLHSTQWGVVCPAETPEGASVGLVKNMAIMAGITIHTDSTHVKEIIKDIGVVFFEGDISVFKAHSSTHVGPIWARVVLNGNILGVHDNAKVLYDTLRSLKRRGVICVYTGIYWNVIENEIAICTEGGRCVRPLFIVNTQGELNITPEFLENYKNAKYNWNDVVVGLKPGMDEPIIEYLDVEESNNALIAMTVKDLQDGRVGLDERTTHVYTHMEMHPSAILGVLAGSIPFSNHNQAPRNTYQSAMGKQAIGMYARNYQNRFDTVAHVLNYPQKPLAYTKISQLIHTDEMPCGCNVIVAIATFTGYNQEDSLIMNQTSIERGLFGSVCYKTFKEQSNKNHSSGEEEFFCKPDIESTRGKKPYNYDKLESDGFVPENTYVKAGDVIIGKCLPQKIGATIINKDTSVALKNNESGFIDKNACHDRLFINTNGDGYNFCKVRVRSDRIPTIGDKFCVPGNTDVLTLLDGWKAISDVVKGEYILQLDPDTHVATYAPILEHYVFQHDGNMVHIYGRTVDLITTMEHKMYVSDQPYNTCKILEPREFNLVEAKQIMNNMVFKKGAIMHNVVDTEINNRSTAILMGAWLNRGYLEPKDRIVVFNTVHTDIVNDIINVLTHMRVENELVLTGATKTIKVKSEFLYMHLKGIENDVFYPSCLYSLDATLSKLCVEMITDKEDTIHMTNERASELQRLVVHAGGSLDIAPIDDRRCIATIHWSEPYEQDWSIEKLRFNGNVYCVEVPTHVFYVRYRGTCMWTGNSSRHGQKGTVGMVYRQEDMPFTASGLVPDIIVNPHAIPSRMTIAQLMECIMGKACCALGTYGDATPFTNLSMEELAETLKKQGMEMYGNEVMYNSRTGEQIDTNIFIGPTFYQRLKHMVSDKQHSRGANGPVVMLTRQPAEGRARDGGLRLGEMEIECNWAHGTMQFLKERFMECSDNFRVHVCRKCGMMATVNPEKNIYLCKPCKNVTQFAEIRIPYACKLLFQEIQTMSIGTSFLLKK